MGNGTLNWSQIDPPIKRSKILQLIAATLKDTESQCASLHFEYKLAYTKRLRDVTTHRQSAEGVGAGAYYKHNIQQYFLILIYAYETRFIN